MGLGPYPAVSLKAVRRLHKDAEESAKLGINPIEERAVKARKSATLEVVTEEYFETREDGLKTGRRWLSPFQHVFPNLGGKPIDPTRFYRVATKTSDLTNGQSPPWSLWKLEKENGKTLM